MEAPTGDLISQRVKEADISSQNDMLSRPDVLIFSRLWIFTAKIDENQKTVFHVRHVVSPRPSHKSIKDQHAKLNRC